MHGSSPSASISRAAMASVLFARQDYLKARAFMQRYEAANPISPEVLYLGWQIEQAQQGAPAPGSDAGLPPSINGSSARTLSGSARRPSGSRVVVNTVTPGQSVLIARTNAFGYFSFANVPTGATYLLSARTKILSVRPTVVGVFDDVTGLELVAEPDLF